MFKFTIRDLLWLTLVVALALGWWLHHRVWAEKYSALALDCDMWHARTEALQVRADMLVERLQARPMPTASAPAKNLPGN